MVHNFLRAAIRNLLKHRVPSILKILGLAIGVSCSLYVYLYVHYELTYDTQHPDPHNTYRVVFQEKGPGKEPPVNAWAPHGWGRYLQENIKGIKAYSSINRAGWPFSFFTTEKNGDQRIVLSQDGILIMKNYTDLFFLELLEGDNKSMMDHPNDILVSETAARELFDNESALNKQLEFSHPYYSANKKVSVVIKGVFRDLPHNMQFGRSAKYLLNCDLQKGIIEGLPGNPGFENMLTALWWPAWSGFIYFQTEPGTDLEAARKQLNGVVNEAIRASGKQLVTVEALFIPLTDLHFSDVPHITLPEIPGNKQYIYIFVSIGAFMLLICCINYVNMSTAQSTQRAKEVGLRKAVGSDKRQIVLQFLQEAFLVTGVSVILGLIICIVFLQDFSAFSNKQFGIQNIFSSLSLSFIVLLWILVSVLSGIYPALCMSSLNAVATLKGDRAANKSGNAFRNGLVVFQFAISLTLMVFTLVVIRQMDKMINSDLNRSGDRILAIRYGNIAPLDKLNVFRNELARDAGLFISSFGNHLPRKESYMDLSFEVTLPERSDVKYKWEMMCIGADFPAVYDLELVAGRFFDSTGPIDSTEILVNEEAARQLNLHAADLVGQRVKVTDHEFKREYFFTIRGVLRDFKYKSVKHKILPLILSLQKDRINSIIYYVKLPAEKVQQKVGAIKEIWKNVMPKDVGMSYWFVSEDFEMLYAEENALFDLSRVFTMLAVITTCIGLFGMSVFLAERRSREMAIRKVAGADSYEVLKRMLLPFLMIVAIGCMIGVPVSYYLSNKWLDNFVYKVEETGIIVALSISVLLVVTLVTVGFQALKVANSKPVDWLKQE